MADADADAAAKLQAEIDQLNAAHTAAPNQGGGGYTQVPGRPDPTKDLGSWGAGLLNLIDRGTWHSVGSSGGLGGPMLPGPEVTGMSAFDPHYQDLIKGLPSNEEVTASVEANKKLHPVASAAGRAVGQLPQDILLQMIFGPVGGGMLSEGASDLAEGAAGRRPFDARMATDVGLSGLFAHLGGKAGGMLGNYLEPLKSYAADKIPKYIADPISEFFGPGKEVAKGAGVPAAGITPSRGAQVGINEAREKGLLQTRPDQVNVSDAPKALEQQVQNVATAEGRGSLLDAARLNARIPMGARSAETMVEKAKADIAAQVANNLGTRITPVNNLTPMANRELDEVRAFFPRPAWDSPAHIGMTRQVLEHRMQSSLSEAQRADYQAALDSLDQLMTRRRPEAALAENVDRQVAQQARVGETMAAPTPKAQPAPEKPGWFSNPTANAAGIGGMVGGAANLVQNMGHITPLTVAGGALAALGAGGKMLGQHSQDFAKRASVDAFANNAQAWVDSLKGPIYSRIFGTPVATETLKQLPDPLIKGAQREMGGGRGSW